MGIRTGQQYLDRLNASTPHVVIGGEVVSTRIAEHPAFRDAARMTARLLDMQHEAEHRDALTVVDDAGERTPASFLAPTTLAELEHRRRAAQTWAEHTHGFLGRTPDYLGATLTALEAAAPWFAEADERFGQRVRAYVAWARANDVVTTHTLIPPQVNRSVSGSEQLGGQVAAHVVEERPDGIVVRGARALATSAPIADELLVLPSTVLRGGPDDAPYSYAFAIPNDAPGLRYYCRRPLQHGGAFHDEPLARRFDEMDALVVFDDVLVPHDRVFLLGHPDRCNELYSATGAAALMTHQVVARTVAKTEFYLGLASEIAEGIGIEQFQHVQEQLAELIAYVELSKALLRAAEVDGGVNAYGLFLPRWETLNAARNWFPRFVSPRLPEIIRTLSASGLMALPVEADLASADARADLDRYLQGATLTAEQRIGLFSLALDASVTGFAGRETLYERFFFGDPVRMAGALVRSYDREPVRARVRELLTREGY